MGQNCLSRPTLKLIRCKAKPGCSPRRYTPRRLLVIANWSPTFSAAVALLVLCRRTRTQCCGFKKNRNLLTVACHGRSSVYWCVQQNSSMVEVDLVYYIYDSRARSGWMHSVYYTLVNVTKQIVWTECTWCIHRLTVTGIFNASWLSPPSCG